MKKNPNNAPNINEIITRSISNFLSIHYHEIFREIDVTKFHEKFRENDFTKKMWVFFRSDSKHCLVQHTALFFRYILTVITIFPGPGMI